MSVFRFAGNAALPKWSHILNTHDYTTTCYSQEGVCRTVCDSLLLRPFQPALIVVFPGSRSHAFFEGHWPCSQRSTAERDRSWYWQTSQQCCTNSDRPWQHWCRFGQTDAQRPSPFAPNNLQRGATLQRKERHVMYMLTSYMLPCHDEGKYCHRLVPQDEVFGIRGIYRKSCKSLPQQCQPGKDPTHWIQCDMCANSILHTPIEWLIIRRTSIGQCGRPIDVIDELSPLCLTLTALLV